MSSSGDPHLPQTARYVAPDFKRRQLLFDSFTKLGAAGAGGGGQKNISDAAVGHGRDGEVGPKGTLLYTWGAGYHGQLGLNTFRKKCRLIPACIDFADPVLVVACGGFHTAVLTDDGRVYSWGDGRYGQLGNLARKHNMHSTPHLVDWLVSFKVTITSLACGQYHTAAISNQGKLFTWGSGKWGQLGHGVRLDERFPRRVEAERQKFGLFTKVSCGDRHTAVVNDQGKVITWGSGQHGQLGHSNGSDQLRPVMINDPEGELAGQFVVSIDCGATTTAAVTNTGLFFLWGFSDTLPWTGGGNIQDAPRLVPMREPVKQVASGQSHILVLTEAGDVYAMGVASMGQIGHGSRANVRRPRLVLRGKEIHQVAAGRYHSMAVSAYGVLYSWGCGESGQCGHNSLESELFPKIVENILPSVVGQISCGEHHSFALSSIAHSCVSADVLNWKLIEDEELKLKRAMLHDVPNGLKSKHILQVEQERKGIIRQLAESLKKEREENGNFAQLQMSLIRQPEELVEDVARVQEDLLSKGDPDAIATVSAMAAAAQKLILPPGGGAAAGEQAGVQFESGQQTMPPSAAHSHRSMRAEDDDEQHAAQHDEDPARRRPHKRAMGGSVSEAVLPRAHERGLSNVASSPDLLYEEEAKQNASATPAKKHGQLVALSNKPRPHTQGPSMSASHSTPSLFASPSSNRLAPLHRPHTALTAVKPPRSARHDLSRTEHLDSHGLDSPHGGEHGGAGGGGGGQLVEFHASPSSSGSGAFQPLVPRMAFMEQTSKALTWVKNLVAVSEDSAHTVNYNVLRLQKQFNTMRAQRAQRAQKLDSLKGQLALCRPSPEEEELNNKAADRIKQLNMRLVTLNTRLMEAEENKRNYELYIIRMKEEDLQLSKQIEHLRQLVTEYDRLLAKVARMSQRVQGQKSEVSEELARFQSDISEFVDFADRTVHAYRSMLQTNFRKNQKLDSEMERKQENGAEASRNQLSKLESALSATEHAQHEQKEQLESWEDKVSYYEKRFRKLSNSTGLSRSEQIIAKHYFDSEITSDLKLDIESKQDALLALQEQHQQLEQQLGQARDTHADSRWRDVGQLEEANVNAVHRLLKAKSDSELWAQKVTLVEEGLLQLTRTVQYAMASRQGLSPEATQAMLLGASPPLAPTSPKAALGPAPEVGLRVSELEAGVTQQLDILLKTVERERLERAERLRAKLAAEKTHAARKAAAEQSANAAAIEMGKQFVTSGGAALQTE